MKFDIIILGGGVTGLTAAYNLIKHQLRPLILEKEDELGGLLGSYRFENFTIEKYYHHCFKRDVYFFKLIEELGLEDQLRWLPSSVGYLIGKKIYPLDTPLQILRFSPLNLLDKLRLAITTLKSKSIRDFSKLDDQEAVEWIIKNCGQNVYLKFFEPLIYGKFGSAAGKISAAWLASRIKLRSHRSPFGEKLGYLKDGFATFVNELAKRVSERGEIKTRTKVDRIIIEKGEIKGVKVASEVFEGSRIISTVGPQSLLELAEFPEELQRPIKEIKFQGVICLLIGLSQPLTHTYWLNIGLKNLPFCLLVEHTNFYKSAAYRCQMVYLVKYLDDRLAPFWRKNDEEIFKEFLSGLKEIFKIHESQILWWRVARTREGGPIYATHLFPNLPLYQSPVPGLFLAGMLRSFPERSINECIRQGLACSEIVLST